MIDVLLLSVLQGIAEFLPISSSGHLALGKMLLGMDEPGLRLDIFLHVGTLVSICVFYFSIIARIVKECNWRYLSKIVVSAIPAGVVGVLFKDQLESAFSDSTTIAVALMFTGVVLTVTRFIRNGDRGVSYYAAIMMGIAQAIAILPGVSRSGMTISMAKLCDVEPGRSAEFSFLMSIPPIAGAALLEILKSTESAGSAVAETSWPLVIFGGIVAALVGFFALKFLLQSLKSNRFWLFGPYCLVMGIVTLVVG